MGPRPPETVACKLTRGKAQPCLLASTSIARAIPPKRAYTHVHESSGLHLSQAVSACPCTQSCTHPHMEALELLHKLPRSVCHGATKPLCHTRLPEITFKLSG